MKKLFFLLTALLLISTCFAQLKVESLLTENQADPLSIDALTPRFSWMIVDDGKRGLMQTAYEIKVSSYDVLKKGKHEVWNTGKITSDQSVYVPYKGEALTSGKKILLAG